MLYNKLVTVFCLLFSKIVYFYLQHVQVLLRNHPANYIKGRVSLVQLLHMIVM